MASKRVVTDRHGTRETEDKKNRDQLMSHVSPGEEERRAARGPPVRFVYQENLAPMRISRGVWMSCTSSKLDEGSQKLPSGWSRQS